MNTEYCLRLISNFLRGHDYVVGTFSTLRNESKLTINWKSPTIDYYKRPFLCFILLQYNKHNGHWLVCYIGRNKRVELFNSIGWEANLLAIVYDALKQLLKTTSLSLTSNVNRVQCRSSSNCGLFCVYYAYQRFVLKRSFDEIMQTLHPGENCFKNDHLLHQFESVLRKRKLRYSY